MVGNLKYVLLVTLIVVFSSAINASNPDDFSWSGKVENQQQLKEPKNFVELLREIFSLENVWKTYSYWWSGVTLENAKFFSVEILLLTLIISYFGLLQYAKQKYNHMAKYWAFSSLPIYRLHFALIGDGNKTALFTDNIREYIVYGSGNSLIDRSYGFLKFTPRFQYGDIVQYFFDAQSGKSLYDSYSLKLQLNESFKSIKFVFAILPKINYKRFIKDRWDLLQYGQRKDLPWYLLPKSEYILLTDAPEFAEKLLSDPLVNRAIWRSVGFINGPLTDPEFNTKLPSSNNNLMKKYSAEATPFIYPLIESLIYSDLPHEKPIEQSEITEPRVPSLSFKYRLNSTNKFHERFDALLFNDNEQNKELNIDLSYLVFDFVTSVASIGAKLNSSTIADVNKLREKIIESIDKEKELQKRKEIEEQKYREKKEKESNIINLTPEQQRIREEKDRKKQAKKQMKKQSKSGRVVA